MSGEPAKGVYHWSFVLPPTSIRQKVSSNILGQNKVHYNNRGEIVTKVWITFSKFLLNAPELNSDIHNTHLIVYKWVSSKTLIK